MRIIAATGKPPRNVILSEAKLQRSGRSPRRLASVPEFPFEMFRFAQHDQRFGDKVSPCVVKAPIYCF